MTSLAAQFLVRATSDPRRSLEELVNPACLYLTSYDAFI
jgi:hypothetical protein